MSDELNLSNQIECASSKFRPRILTSDLAYKIYREKDLDSLDDASLSRKSADVASKYGTSAKTVRDIWSKRTWTGATEALWSAEEVLEHAKREKRGPGRPLGARDSRPRKKRPYFDEQTAPHEQHHASSPRADARLEVSSNARSLTQEEAGGRDSESEAGVTNSMRFFTEITPESIERAFQEDLD
ncbi:hypothetical protein GUITHDRAFT_118814 [Guillardia theta CCMP2712]|uniref:Uncharacterized protein n=1 Tax=Guillardia theta (strain CCMP2712) TaxID=905079 RepID=L1IFG0_GUITC|nr:hypothetical protein GUITHDRAFT_118814 [Guillardia theta CCMP2712]EKX34973.1 hypothetical protein GUITHDRAFT_118814 [Guillardia theta CCMP2712]|eukprot:XP_005821953.1 hypothetical protein GUITHDRAFT_118814 [Guillardia theta CCMP2712]